MKIEYRTLPAAMLQPAAYNPRKQLAKGSAGYRRLARSIAEFGLVQPIVWNERTGRVVGGHQRLQVLLDTGTTELDCVVVSLSDAQEKSLNVALNNSQIGSTWDDAKLVDLLAELRDLPTIDATLTGFDAADLNELLFAPAEDPPSLSDADPAADEVRVTLAVPQEAWDAVRSALDDLTVRHPIGLHVWPPR